MPVAINAYLTTLALSSYLSTRGTAFCQHWRWGCNPHDRTDKELVGVVTLFCPFHFALSVRDLSLAHWVSLLSLPAPHPAPQLWLFLSFSVSQFLLSQSLSSPPSPSGSLSSAHPAFTLSPLLIYSSTPSARPAGSLGPLPLRSRCTSTTGKTSSVPASLVAAQNISYLVIKVAT